MSDGDYVVVRAEGVGVFVGELVDRDEQYAILRNARAVWPGDATLDITRLAMEGARPGECRFTAPVPEVYLTRTLAYLTCSPAAAKNIRRQPKWRGNLAVQQ